MDRYWSYVGTPLFYSVIGFGVFTLFVTQDVQVAKTSEIKGAVKKIQDASDEKEKKDSPASVAAPATPKLSIRAPAPTAPSKTPPSSRAASPKAASFFKRAMLASTK
jgi:hypothetical protein